MVYGYIAKRQPSILAAAAKMSTALLHNQILAANLFLQNIELPICRAALMQGNILDFFKESCYFELDLSC